MEEKREGEGEGLKKEDGKLEGRREERRKKIEVGGRGKE